VIGVDWGTTRCRAYRLCGEDVRDYRESELGIQHVEADAFGRALQSLIGPWLVDGERQVLLAGMVGSRQGWRETAYLPCPVSTDDVARALVPIPYPDAVVLLAPGVSAADGTGVPELMRGEEAQIFGADIERGSVCLPGTHSKWVRVEERRIVEFSTYLTGDVFAALRDHTILRRSIREGPDEFTAFDAGVSRASDPGGLLHHLFGIRALGLAQRLTDVAAGSYLSGLLIGHEVGAAVQSARPVHLIGATQLTGLYARAIVARAAWT
jgi:2-dehydro-3-deoxygalactonokinase